MIHKLLMVALGGSIGAVLRYLVYLLYERVSTHPFPWATIAVNLIGSFLIGLLWGLFDKYYVSPGLRLFLFIGILGSFTTFSTFAFELFSLAKDGNIKHLIIYILTTNIFGLALATTGYYISRIF